MFFLIHPCFSCPVRTWDWRMWNHRPRSYTDQFYYTPKCPNVHHNLMILRKHSRLDRESIDRRSAWTERRYCRLYEWFLIFWRRWLPYGRRPQKRSCFSSITLLHVRGRYKPALLEFFMRQSVIEIPFCLASKMNEKSISLFKKLMKPFFAKGCLSHFSGKTARCFFPNTDL